MALHELGHALGLGHSDNPNDVMYPYLKIVTGLADGDKAAILSLYAARTGIDPAARSARSDDQSLLPPRPAPRRYRLREP